jgi:hypothetical protein
MPDQDVERRIITGFIVSDEFLRRTRYFWRDEFLEAPELIKVAKWCIAYFDKYECAPNRHIEDVYMRELQANNLEKSEAEYIERILSRISDEYERGEQFNAQYLFDRATEYFRTREWTRHNEAVQDLIDRGELAAAEAERNAYKPLSWVTSRGIDVGSEEGLKRLAAAFTTASKPILTYPGALGAMLNQHFIRGGFVGLMGPSKRGKTYWLLDIAMRGLRQKLNVAFFQAGDSPEDQFLRRIAIHISGRSDQEQYCKEHWRPIGDCVFNQIDKCDRADRNCDHGIFDATAEQYKSDRTVYAAYDVLVKAAEANRGSDHALRGKFSAVPGIHGYQPCDSASCTKRWPCVWLVEEPAVQPLTGTSAKRAAGRFFEKYKRRFKLVTYPSGTLTVDEMESCLDEWERQDDFVADIIISDYADIMDARVSDFRHKQNEIWKGLRSLSQKKRTLVVTATQADAASYRANSLTLSNFSEDKRKFDHVTAMFGLNQSPDGRERQLGIMRINELVIREGAQVQHDVTVLQDLRKGKPFLESFAIGIHPDRNFDG